MANKAAKESRSAAHQRMEIAIFPRFSAFPNSFLLPGVMVVVNMGMDSVTLRMVTASL